MPMRWPARAPTYGAWNPTKAVSARNSVRSTSPQPHRVRCLRPAKVQVPVLEPGLLTDGLVQRPRHLEGQRRALVEHDDLTRGQLDRPGGQAGVLVALRTPADRARHLEHVLVQ